MSYETFDLSKDTEDTAEDIYHQTVMDGAAPASEYPKDHIAALKEHELIEPVESEPAQWVYMTRKGMDWIDNVVNCQHHRCAGNYEDVYCMDCGADYNNGRLL